jgi:ribonuclease-3
MHLIKKPQGSEGSSNGDNESDSEKLRRESDPGADLPKPLGKEEFYKIEQSLGYSFKDYKWLERALTHRSAQAKGVRSDYERLEFLGDAVVDLGVAQLLLDQHLEAREGELSKMRAALVNTTSLAEIARSMQLGAYIRLSRGEMVSGGADRSSILADVMEAVFGAIFREAGFDEAFKCITRLYGDKIKNVTPVDPKTELQELLHAAGRDAPDYLLECVEGPEHAPTFISIVQIEGNFAGRGKGATKKASQQEAAAEALSKLKSGSEGKGES